MKFTACCLLLFMITGFSACENHMDIKDEAKGTPSKADTVMPHRFPDNQKAGSSKEKNVARVFLR